MAKRRKVTRARKVRRQRKNADQEETMNIIAGILVVILIGLGIYFYQTTQKTGALPLSNAVAMAVDN